MLFFAREHIIDGVVLLLIADGLLMGRIVFTQQCKVMWQLEICRTTMVTCAYEVGVMKHFLCWHWQNIHYKQPHR